MSCGRIAALVMNIQNDFLNTAELTLTLSQAQHRFGIDDITCEAILSALVDANVLMKAPDRSYRRFFPRLALRTDMANEGRHQRRQKSDAGQPIAGVAA